MSLKQIKPSDRIIFLKKFVAEILINSGEPKTLEEIKIEKLRQKFFKPAEPEKSFAEPIYAPIFQEPIYPKEIKSEFIPSQFDIKAIEYSIPIPVKRKLSLHRIKHLRKPPKKQRIIPLLHMKKSQPIFSKQMFAQQKAQIPPQIKALKEVRPVAQERPQGLALGRLEPLVKDLSVQSIECPGPGKNVLVKKYNKINVTKIIMSKSEIDEIIDNFSKNAMIPVVGGILKAAVGDLVISAVISEYVGSRFILNKITPYNAGM